MAFTKRVFQKGSRILDRILNIEDYLAGGGAAADNYTDVRLNTEEKIGTYAGVDLYRYVTVVDTSTTSWSNIKHLDITTYYIVRIEGMVMNYSGTSVMAPYYVSASDQFRIGVENGYLKAQLGTSTPSKPAHVFAWIYYTKEGV